MHKIRDVLRLSAACLSKRNCGEPRDWPDRSRGMPAPGARALYRLVITWSLPNDLGDAAPKRRLYPAPAAATKDGLLPD